MINKNTIKEYKTEELTVIWDSSKCIHAGVCVRTLPKVYNPKARPWIEVKNATTDELIDQIDQCPSGALSYVINKK